MHRRTLRRSASEAIKLAQEPAGVAGRARGNVFGRAVRDDVTAFVTRVGPQVNDPIGALDDVEVVLDDEHRMAGINETLKSFQQNADVVEVQAGGRFVEEE